MGGITGSPAPELHGAATLGGARAWWVWSIAVAFVIYLFSVQTGYSIVNPVIQQSLTLTVTQITAIAATYTWRAPD